jgi:RNA polymerase-binding transcription factor DksA
VTELKYTVPTGEYHGRLDLDVFRADLEQHRQFRIEQLNELTSHASRGSDDAPDEVTSALVTAAATALSDIDAALQRIEEGGFGVCQGCNEPIARDRLEALPMAQLCMFCQYTKEVSGPRRGPQPPDIVDVWGYGSFPASDPPANW